MAQDYNCLLYTSFRNQNRIAPLRKAPVVLAWQRQKPALDPLGKRARFRGGLTPVSYTHLLAEMLKFFIPGISFSIAVSSW